MFNLIVAVISIALIAAMAAASIFYGGSAFSSGTAQAAATTLINNGQQISGAQQLHMIDKSGNRAVAIGELTLDGQYLQAVPTPPSMADGAWDVDASGLTASVVLTALEAPTVCEEVFNQGGVDGVEEDAAFTDIATSLELEQFGCFTDAGEVTFVYKL